MNHLFQRVHRAIKATNSSNASSSSEASTATDAPSTTAAAAVAATGISAERQREILLQSAAVKFICRADFVARVQQSDQPQVIHKVTINGNYIWDLQ